MTGRPPQDEILVAGLDDGVHPDVDVVLRSDLAGDGAAREVPLEPVLARCDEVLGELLSKPLVQVGDISRHGLPPRAGGMPDIIAQISEDWSVLGGRPNLGEVAWLCNTEAGDARARQALAGKPTAP